MSRVHESIWFLNIFLFPTHIVKTIVADVVGRATKSRNAIVRRVRRELFNSGFRRRTFIRIFSPYVSGFLGRQTRRYLSGQLFIADTTIRYSVRENFRDCIAYVGDFAVSGLCDVLEVTTRALRTTRYETSKKKIKKIALRVVATSNRKRWARSRIYPSSIVQ